MPFNSNVPQPTDNLSDSQGDLLSNFQSLDTSFGIDHYKFSDLTANNGFHNTVTTPIIVGSAHPTTAAGICKFYAMQDGTAVSNVIPLLQYSRGPSNAIPSPQTYVHSGLPADLLSSATVDIVDFTGITNAIFIVTAVSLTSGTGLAMSMPGGYKDPGIFSFFLGGTQNPYFLTKTGNLLKLSTLQPNQQKTIWTIQFLRLE